jgi:hypothetical protein
MYDVTYLDMVQQFAVPQADLRLDTVFLHQDGSPRHVIDDVVPVLNETHPDRWLGGGVLIAWPRTSPDLIFSGFLWGVNQIEQQDCRGT